MTDPVDVSGDTKNEQSKALYKYLRKYEVVTIDAFSPRFDLDGAATGADVVALWSQTDNFYTAARDLVLAQNATELAGSWLFANGVDKPDIRADLLAVGVVVTALLDTLEVVGAAFTLDRATSKSAIYSAASTDDRALVKAGIDAVAALIVT
ncbi:hypothetical protein K0U83_11545 [bacterium]|nr:hypothetical protein [bacterium]